MFRTVLTALLMVLPLAAAEARAASNTTPRVFQAVRVEHAPTLDGRLDDPAWQRAEWQGDFRQREPNEGAPGSESTFVAVLYDHNALYVGVRCDDRQPDQIVAREKRRDAILDQDDNFQIVLDTYHDKRSGYYFIINPLGARRDAMLSDEGRVFNPEWDGIWACRARITPKGWQAEIRIPWATLRFPKRDTLTMGINFLREIRRRNEQQYWQLVPRGQGFFGLARLSQAGTLTGLVGVRGGSAIEFRPYVLGGAQRDVQTAFRTHRESNAGLDVKLTPGSNLALDLTWNTDFAQVEADQEQVNLTRFSLYYPEKREFFLEGAELFAFGPSGGGHGRLRGGPLQIFYSRRIGLVERSTVPILGGLRLTGKEGGTRFGLLNVSTDHADLPCGRREPRTNYTAVRVRHDVFSRSSVGLMALNKQILEGQGYNRTFGLDASLAPSVYTYLDLAAAATFSPGNTATQTFRDKANLAWYGKVGYRSDLWAFSLSHLDVGPAFNPEMGFLKRRDIRTTSGMLRYMPRPEHWPSVRKFFYTVRAEDIRNHRGTLLNQNLELSFGTRFQNSTSFWFRVEHFYEYLETEWPIRSGILIPQGAHSGVQWSGRFRGDESRSIVPGLRASVLTGYGGKMVSLNPDAVLTVFPNSRIELVASFNRVVLPQGSFSATTSALRFVYYFSTSLYLKAFLQWKDDPLANDGGRLGLANVLLRWTIREGTDLYVVYNESLATGFNPYTVQNRVLLAKFVWFKRI